MESRSKGADIVEEFFDSSSKESTEHIASSATIAKIEDGPDASTAVNFLKQIVEDDIKTGKHESVVTRFPPEPNGFLHLGHAKSICINFGLAKAFNGHCNLRFDDTNPTKEEMRYIESIKRDVKWMGGDWGEHLYYASDYFDQLYEWAEDLIKKGLAFVDEESLESIREKRGSITQKGEPSAFRDRPVEDNLLLFRRMKDGEFNEGSKVLRARIDMGHSNLNMRDPILYRILKKSHPRTGDKWCIYPMYDFAHGQSDSIEKITHSICTLEFELHRPLYEWFQKSLGIFRTRQIEFARLNCTYTVMSKRKLLILVEEGFVEDWSDPRLPTLSAFRRRGVPAAALRLFCEKIGIARRESTIQIEVLERCIREYLHKVAHRRFAIVNPLKVKITNFFSDKKTEEIEAPNHPEDPSFGSRQLLFTPEFYIDRDDFTENPDKDFFRLAPGKEVRLKYAYWIKCNDVVKDDEGTVTELLCTFDKTTKNVTSASDGRKVKGTIHWLAVEDAIPAEFFLYGRLFSTAFPEEESEGEYKTWRDHINKHSLVVRKGFVESSAAIPESFPPGSSIQFERVGFFTPDCGRLEKQLLAEKTEELQSSPKHDRVYNLTIELQESFSTSKEKVESKEKERQKDKDAREKAAKERQRIKEEREARKKMKDQKRHEP